MGKINCQCWSWLTPNNLTDYAKATKSFDKTGHHPDCPLGKKRPQKKKEVRMKKAKERNAEEYRLQCAIGQILQVLVNQGEIRGFYHWPNGMRVSIGQAMKFKKMGMKKGPWDLYVVLNSGDILWIECKSEKGVLSEEQKKFRDIHEGAEHIFFHEVRSVAEAIEELDRLWVKVPDCFVPKCGL